MGFVYCVMQITQEQEKTIKLAISYWEGQQLISTATAETLRQSYNVTSASSSFDWKNFSLLAFFFSVSCIVLATVLFLLDDWLMGLVNRWLGASAVAKCGIFLLLALFTFALGLRRRRRFPLQKFSNEALLIFGAIFIAFFLTYLSEALQMEEGNFPVFVGLGAIIYGFIAIYIKSHLLWGISLVSFTIWYGMETFYWSQEQYRFLGMNFPLRYVFFGILLLIGSFGIKKTTLMKNFYQLTYYSGLIILLASLWMFSIFGNQADLTTWNSIPQYQFWYAVLLLTGICVTTIWWGLNKNDRLTAEIGIFFILLNIYTRYFEYAWEGLHPVVFFSVLALSFWLIGKKAEGVWNRLEKG